MAVSETGGPAVTPPRQLRLAIWIFWCAFVTSSVTNRALLSDVLVANPSVLAIFGIKALIYIALTFKLLRGARWARTIFALLFAVDVLDSVSDAWLLISIPRGVPHVPILLGSELAFDSIYAYAVFLLFSRPSASWFGIGQVGNASQSGFGR